MIDDVLLQADCSGFLNAYDVKDTSIKPERLWRFPVGNGCLEALRLYGMEKSLSEIGMGKSS